MIGKIIDLPRIYDPRGNLTVVEQLKEVPFDIKRVYWTYDVPGGESRGGHAHKKCQSFIIAVSGSFTVRLDDGHKHETYHLNHPYQGLLINTGVWRTLEDFSSGAVCLALASELFDENDYIREYDDFIRYVEDKEKGKGPDCEG
ncbi:MAG: FdtA/QdtA family cupin domain-containing protein [Bacteroidales bacterium]|nr:FdtA/QdtA family cupin domain-containing protein [Bacteroidales bacterium]MDY3673533.1 FdtA/QdtA family cupin domain-containing protein [Prevotella sp.]MCI7560199.1 FdtA/QdtA family cupin domain-containing protein [Bacteroidales bacterium]MCI7763171.1 FdtA/QdtA family cupin domain-containing protein [Bacteroidales bacterium]MDD5812625.1 FdtA/QdtA family cupin domain-containing protein [Bacteroidales bacterium]